MLKLSQENEQSMRKYFQIEAQFMTGIIRSQPQNLCRPSFPNRILAIHQVMGNVYASEHVQSESSLPSARVSDTFIKPTNARTHAHTHASDPVQVLITEVWMVQKHPTPNKRSKTHDIPGSLLK